ncbi:MAG: hypothetical protein ACT6Q3_10820, partial [Sphingopyxis sp.]
MIAVLGRNDHPELMPILAAAGEERLAIGDIEIGGIKFAGEAFARHAVALDIGKMRLSAAEPLPRKRDGTKFHDDPARPERGVPAPPAQDPRNARAAADPAAVEPPASC